MGGAPRRPVKAERFADDEDERFEDDYEDEEDDAADAYIEDRDREYEQEALGGYANGGGGRSGRKGRHR